MLDRDRQTRVLHRYRHVVSGALLIFLAWAFYQALKRLMFWAAGTFDLSDPGLENLAVLLSLPYLAAVWFSYAWVMGRIDKID